MVMVRVTDRPLPGKPRASKPNPLWTVPKLWPDGECFILGGGPSLKLIDIERLRGRRVIAVNNAYQLGDWIDVMFYGDCRWHDWHKERLKGFGGLKVTVCPSHTYKGDVKVVERRNSPEGLQSNPSRIAWNRCSGNCAVNLAVHFGVKRIILLGYDMHKVDGQSNWHKDHPSSLNPKHDPYFRFLKPWPFIARDARRMHVEILNATPGSALTDVPVVDPEAVLR